MFVSGTLKKAALLHLTETIAITWNTEGIKERFGENTLFPLKLVTQGFSGQAFYYLRLPELLS